MNFRASFNPAPLKRKLGNRSRGFARNLFEEINRAGRLVAVSLATSAQPYGTGDDALEKGAVATARDIQRVYATPSQVYGEIKKNAGKEKADFFYRQFGAAAFTRAQLIIEKYAPQFNQAQIGQFDGGALHKARRNKRGRIPPSQKPLLLVTNVSALKAYIKHEVSRVGFGKAGWANCSKSFVDKGGTRGLPQWVTRHRKAPAAVAIYEGPQGRITVTMFNQVDYAEQILTDADKREAIGIGVDRLATGIFNAETRAGRAQPIS